MAETEKHVDEVILRLLMADDPEAITHLYNAHHKAILNLVKLYLQDSDDAKDIVQDLFISVWERRRSLNLSLPLRKYLAAAAHNRVINFIRGRERLKKNMSGAVSGARRLHQPPDEELQGKELDQLIRIAIYLLPEKTRVAFMLSRRVGMTYKEAAQYLGVSEKAVEKHMTIALKLLRKFLGPYLKTVLFIISVSAVADNSFKL